MRSLILVAVILQLTVTIIEINGYQFGDMISFRKYGVLFKHFAIYVGNETFEGKQDDQDIFHRTRTGCMFGVMARQGNGRVDDLDNRTFGGHTFTKLPDKDIKNHIKALMKGCGEYSVRTNNCEHVATYVRYKLKITRQRRVFACIFCCFSTPRRCPDFDRKVEEMEENARREEACWRSSCPDMAT